jgi:hypothetical protein
MSSTPSNDNAFPNFPLVVHVAPAIVPPLLWPDESLAADPDPSSNPYAATKPAGGLPPEPVAVTLALVLRPAES